MDDTNTGSQQADPLQEVRDLIDRAQRGDETVLPQIRVILDDNQELWRRAGDLHSQVEQQWTKLIVGTSILGRESVKRKADELRSELLGPAPSAVERLLVDRIVATWLESEYLDLLAASSSGTLEERMTTTVQQLRDGASRRYLAAIKELTELRRLLGSKRGIGKLQRPNTAEQSGPAVVPLRAAK